MTGHGAWWGLTGGQKRIRRLPGRSAVAERVSGREGGTEAPERVERHCPSAPDAVSGGPHRRACAPGHALAEVPGLDARSHVEAAEGREAEGAEEHQAVPERGGPGALPVRYVRRRCLLRGSAPGDSSEDRSRPDADSRRGQQGGWSTPRNSPREATSTCCRPLRKSPRAPAASLS